LLQEHVKKFNPRRRKPLLRKGIKEVLNADNSSFITETSQGVSLSSSTLTKISQGASLSTSTITSKTGTSKIASSSLFTSNETTYSPIQLRSRKKVNQDNSLLYQSDGCQSESDFDNLDDSDFKPEKDEESYESESEDHEPDSKNQFSTMKKKEPEVERVASPELFHTPTKRKHEENSLIKGCQNSHVPRILPNGRRYHQWTPKTSNVLIDSFGDFICGATETWPRPQELKDFIAQYRPSLTMTQLRTKIINEKKKHFERIQKRKECLNIA